MATRLTGFSKLMITLVILAALFFGGKYALENTKLGQDLKSQAEQAATQEGTTADNGADSGSKSTNATSTGATNRDPNTLRVQLVTWGGYAPGLYFNEGALANTNSRYYKDYGFKVEFKLENDLINAMNACATLVCLGTNTLSKRFRWAGSKVH